MQVFTLAQALAFPKGSTVPAVKFQIKKVNKLFTGTHPEYGAWSIQALTAVDSSGTCTVKLKNRPEMTKEWEGHWVYCELGVDGKNRPAGIKVEEDTYKNKTTIQILVDDRATVTDAVVKEGIQQPAAPVQAPPPSAAPATPPAAAAPAPTQPPTQSPPGQVHRPAPGSPEDKTDAVRKAKARLGRASVGMLIAFDAAVFVIKEVQRKHGIQMDAEAMQKIAVSFAITLERDGLCDGLPCSLPEAK